MKLSGDLLKVLVYSKQLWPEIIHPIDANDNRLIVPEQVQQQIQKAKGNILNYLLKDIQICIFFKIGHKSL